MIPLNIHKHINMKNIILLGVAILCSLGLAGQSEFKAIEIDGQIVRYMIDEYGDTLFIATLDDMSISSPRTFANSDEERRYKMYKRYAVVVYPYAREAIRIFREVENESANLKNRKRKKFIKEKSNELKEEFEAPLRKLTKTQGKILVKMIENELDTSMYDLIKSLRGNFTASYWNMFSRFYGYRLKEGYIPDDDPILDAVLEDLDISYN